MPRSPLNYTEYTLEANFAFGQTKQPFTHLKRIFITNMYRRMKGDPDEDFPQTIFLALTFRFVSAYTEYHIHIMSQAYTL